MNVIAMTRKGLYKTENEDRIVIGKNLIADGIIQEPLFSGVVAVADGVGGHLAGAVASHFVAQRLTTAQRIDFDALSQINSDLLQLSATRADYYNMATTLSGLFLHPDKTVLFSVGNTRVYTLQGGKYLKQLTTDDTTLNYLLATGQITHKDAETFSRKNEITACFGGGSAQLLHVQYAALDLLPAFVMTSDGIHDYVSIDQMEEILEEHGFSVDACEAFISAARAGGSHDDASVILCSG